MVLTTLLDVVKVHCLPILPKKTSAIRHRDRQYLVPSSCSGSTLPPTSSQIGTVFDRTVAG